MSNPINYALFVTLSDHQQELIAGGADFELAGSNFANRLVNLQGTTVSGPNGSTGNSIGTSSTVNTAAQDLLGLGATTLPDVGALGAAPSLNGQGTVGSPMGGPITAPGGAPGGGGIGPFGPAGGPFG